MKRLMMALAAAAVLTLAACSGAGYDNSDTSPVPQSGNDSSTISVKELGDSGRVLVDSAGQALYAADEEADPSVVCTGGCTNFWIPLTVDEGAPRGAPSRATSASLSVATARGKSRSTLELADDVLRRRGVPGAEDSTMR